MENDFYSEPDVMFSSDEIILPHRSLGAAPVSLDYSVLVVVIFTLALILVIEVGRHKLDVWASENPFFKTVLELMYRELTTLGMVECVIYLLHKYWEDFDLAYEVVFIDIHFMLFYTAVINAIQSSVVRVLTQRLTNKQWTMTEDIDIYHYVAIRKEFDSLEQKFQLDESIPASVHDSFTSGNGFFPENQNHFRSMLDDIAFRVRHPYLSARKKALIVPVRFHELRAHFIESNNLPQRFKVSPYLNLSLTSVLLEFVHISSTAWILLMASANILYFLSGTILDATGYTGSVTTFMVAVYFTVSALFAVLQFLITLKMKSIFGHIINTKSWTTRAAIDDRIDETKAREQLNLFWGGNPHYIIVATQYCQFGYAIGLAVIATYNQQLAEGGLVTTMLFAWIASYSVFLFLVNRMMPWYTLCTSMGQLVNKERLHQTLAKLKLTEELRKQEAIHEELKAKEEMERLQKEKEAEAKRLAAAKEAKPPTKSSLLGITDTIVTNVGNAFKRPSATTEERKRRRKGRQKSISDGVQFMRDFNGADTTTSFFNNTTPQNSSDAVADKLISVHEDQVFEQPLDDKVVGKDDSISVLQAQQTIADRRNARRRLRKSQSENVAVMRETMNNNFALDTSSSPRRRSLDKKSTSLAHVTKPVSIAPQRGETENVTLQQAKSEIETGGGNTKGHRTFLGEVNAPLGKFENGTSEIQTKTVMSTSASMEDMTIYSRENTIVERDSEATNASAVGDRKQERRRRRHLLKTQSEGVAIMRSTLADTDRIKTTPLASVCELGGDEKLETLAGLAKLSAKDLPEIPPFNDGRRRRSRHRSSSDGVSSMALGEKESTDNLMVDPAKRESSTSLSASLKKNSPMGYNTDQPSDGNQAKPNNRVTFAMVHNSSASAAALSKSTDRMSSFASIESIDGDSDIDDVPDALSIDFPLEPRKHSFMRRNIDFASYFQSEKYPAASFLCGPMICLFMIGRVEGFNIQSGVLYDQRNTYHISLHDSFLVECSWYCLMMLEMCAVFTYFTRKACHDDEKSYMTMKSITAAGWGFAINVTCLLLLLIAESQRCCYSSSTNEQPYENSYGGSMRDLGAKESAYAEESYYPSDLTEECTCLKFGSRLYGGLGNIEPFTFLIVLSPLRFLFASYTLRILGFRRDKHEKVSHSSGNSHGGHDSDLKTKARELWLSTVGVHSDVAMKFGMFSGQFLQCMLGIYSADEEDELLEHPTAIVTKEEFDSFQPPIETSIGNTTEREIAPIFSSERETSAPSHPHQRRDAFNFESLGYVFDDFSYPTSRLIRRMRRCERRLLPFLNEWNLVDVVLTSHELVIFDVEEEQGYQVSDSEVDLTTNGGKGLRLCDVAKGRKVLSQFDLDDIDFVDIEHRVATVSDDFNDVENGHEQLLEFWQGGSVNVENYRLDKMNARWCKVNEDRLKIHFKAGGGTTLFLRFTVDLKEMEKREVCDQSGEELSDVGRQAKVWCRTIAHLRGAMNLTKQNLPHFNDDHEMEDFIEMCPREEEVHESNKLKALLRKTSSFAPYDDLDESKSKRIRSALKRSRSTSQFATAGTEDVLSESKSKRFGKRRSMKRSQSMSQFDAEGSEVDDSKSTSKDDLSVRQISAPRKSAGDSPCDTEEGSEKDFLEYLKEGEDSNLPNEGKRV